ncbi:hypothetical protein AK812_SmicGene31656 [Symbiodinium microadriaticum]|uniref:Uncharacterized protein n=1 Tax=Symbiodinium microadriaticum TaxID=2951 RepID=A0A1Q9CW63_SYMMI|nr:hypothetical protein AK812_SmicGene31656 [Symbiodinium microadriaticum]
MAVQLLADVFEKEKLIKKRFKVKGYLVDFPPRRVVADEEDEDKKKENPISTKAMEMNISALKVMFSYFRVTSGKKVPIQKLEAAVKKLYDNVGCEPNPKLGDKQFYLDAWAQGVRELFEIIKTLRDEEDASADAGGEGEEEEEVDDDPLSEGCEEDVSSASKGSTKSSETAKDMDDGRGVAAALADVELDSQEDTQAPRWRYRSKSTLQSLATTAVLGGSKENLGSPAESYGGALTGGQEEELQKLLQEISLYECGADTLVQDDAAGLHGEKGGPPVSEALVREDAPGLDGEKVGPPVSEAIEVDSSPEKIKPSPDPKHALVQPVALDDQLALRAGLREKLRRNRGGKKAGKVSKTKKGKGCADEGSGDAGTGASKRKRGTCDAEPASSVPKAKAKAKARAKAKATPKGKAKATAKALPSEETAEALPKAKAKAQAKGKAKAKSSPRGPVYSGVALKLKPDRSRTGYTECGTLLLGCSSCRWGVLGCGTCRRTNFHGTRWNAVACAESEE